MNNIALIFQLLPLIMDMVKMLEAAIPQQGKGTEKLEALQRMLETLDVGTKAVWPQISTIVSILVDLYNKTGVFKK